jgi:hypothetical protein
VLLGESPFRRKLVSIDYSLHASVLNSLNASEALHGLHNTPANDLAMYQPLLSSPSAMKSDEDISEPDTSRDGQEPSSGNKSLWTRELYIAMIVCVLCVLVNATLLLIFRAVPVAGPSTYPMSAKDIRHLRRPSQFIAFDKVARTSPLAHREFKNYPILLSQIDSAAPDRVFPADMKQHAAHSGTITPQSLRFLLNKTVRKGNT